MKETFTPLISYLNTRPFIQKLFDLVIVFLASFFIAFAWILTNYHSEILQIFEKNHIENVIERNTIFNERAEPLLTNLRIQSNSQLVAFFRYHNGYVGTSGFPFIRKTATNFSTNSESLRENFIIKFTALPTSADINQLETHRNGECLYRVVDTSLPFYFTYDDLGFVSYYTCPVYDVNDFLIGYVSINWQSRAEVSPELETLTNQVAEEIGLLDSIL